VGRLAAVAALRVKPVDGHDRPPPAAPGGAVVVAAVGQIVGARGPQEGAEPAPRLIEPCQVAAPQQVGEEALDQVLGLVGRVAAAAGKGVEGEPVVAAEPLQRGAGRGVSRVAGAGDAAPAGRREAGRRRVL
jgi:hypothetical protein